MLDAARRQVVGPGRPRRPRRPATGCSSRSVSSSRPGSWSRARPTPFALGTSRTSSPWPSSWRRASHSATARDASRASRPNTTTSTPRSSGATEPRATEEMLRFTTALTLFWELRGHLAKGGRWFARVLRDDDAPPTVERARALWGAAHVALYGDDFETMQVRAPQALAMAEAVGDDWAAGRALNTLGFATVLFDPVGRPRPVGAQHRARTGDRRRLGRRRWLEDDDGRVLRRARRSGRRRRARPAPTVGEQLESEFFLAWYRFMVGYFAMHRGDYAVARAEFARSLESCRRGRRPFDRRLCRGVRPRRAGRNRRSRRCRRRSGRVDRPRERGGRRVRARRGGRVSRGHRARDRRHRRCARVRRAAHRDDSRTRRAPVDGAAPPGARRGEADRPATSTRRRPRSTKPPRSSSRTTTTGSSRLIEYERALVAHGRGEPARAEDLLHSALDRQARHDLKPGITATLDALGALALDAESPSEAVRCFAAADALRAGDRTVRPAPSTRQRAPVASTGRETSSAKRSSNSIGPKPRTCRSAR